MKKKLPNIYKNNINKTLNNNKRVFYSANNSSDNNKHIYSIDDLFKQNEIYRTSVLITLNDNTKIEKIIIGRSIKHLITKDNELIPIDNIIRIERK